MYTSTDGVAAPKTPVRQEPSGTALTPLYPTGGLATERVKEVIHPVARGNHAPTHNVAAPKTPVVQEPSGTALTLLYPTGGFATD